MWNNLIGTHIRRANWNLMLTSLICLLILLLVAFANARYLENVITGSRPISSEKIATLQNPEMLRHYFVRVTGEQSMDVGITEVEQRRDESSKEVKSEKVTAHFLLLVVDNKFLLVKSDSAEEASEVVGALVPIPNQVDSEVVSQLRGALKDRASNLLPFMLDATDFRTGGIVGMAIGVPTALFAVWGVLLYSRRAQEPGLHPIAQSLKKYGDPEDIALAVDTDFRIGSKKFGSTILCRNWLINPSTYGLSVTRLDDLAWVYQKVTKHSVNFIPTGKSYSAVLCNRDGTRLEVQADSAKVQELLTLLINRNPWMMVGYDALMEKAWNQDRVALLQVIDQNRNGSAGLPQ